MAIALRLRLALLPIVAALLAGGVAAAAEAPPSAPKEAVSAEQIDKLIRQLGDKDYFVRQRAQDELAHLGFEAFDAVTAATNDGDLEIAARAKYLLKLMRVEWTVESDPAAVKQYLADYESADAGSREQRMQGLAALPGGQGTAALCRLVRFERTLLLSKVAALALLRSRAAADPPNAATIEAVRKILAGCKRSGAAWLLAWTRLGDESEAVMAEWSRFIDDEQQLLRQSHNETSSEIVAGLIRYQVARLKKLGKSDAAMTAILRLVDVEPGDPETLAELLPWLVEQKAWKAVDELAERFSQRFAEDAGLLYLLAEAYAEQGRKDRAEETATRGFRLYPGKEQVYLFQHLITAHRLCNRGRFDWARREFEHVMAQGNAEQNGLLAGRGLADMFHDQGQDLQAATTFETLLGGINVAKLAAAERGNRELQELRCRMNYFYACHWEAEHDLAKQREYLNKALEINPADVDVLIACYRLPNQPPEYHAKIVDLIQRKAASDREELNKKSDDASICNNFAWLIANTEGDFDRALKCAQTAVELRPDEGGLLDTLARVYFAKGDLENAVKHQTRAVELEPHSGLIKRQLELFRKKLEEKKKP